MKKIVIVGILLVNLGILPHDTQPSSPLSSQTPESEIAARNHHIELQTAMREVIYPLWNEILNKEISTKYENPKTQPLYQKELPLLTQQAQERNFRATGKQSNNVLQAEDITKAFLIYRKNQNFLYQDMANEVTQSLRDEPGFEAAKINNIFKHFLKELIEERPVTNLAVNYAISNFATQPGFDDITPSMITIYPDIFLGQTDVSHALKRFVLRHEFIHSLQELDSLILQQKISQTAVANNLETLNLVKLNKNMDRVHESLEKDDQGNIRFNMNKLTGKEPIENPRALHENEADFLPLRYTSSEDLELLKKFYSEETERSSCYFSSEGMINLINEELQARKTNTNQ